MDPVVASANHSCIPNTVTVYDGQSLSFRALKPIAENEEVFISYVDVTNPYRKRQSELDDRFYFRCRCELCGKGRDAGQDDHLTTSESDDIDSLQGLEDDAFETLEKARNLPLDERMSSLDAALQHCSSSGAWPQYRQPLPSIRQEVFVNLLKPGTYARAFMHGLKLYFDVHPLLYPQSFHPVSVVHTWTLAHLAMYLAFEPGFEIDKIKDLPVSEFDTGVIIVGLMLEVLDNVMLSHGESSEFAKRVKTRADEIRLHKARENENESARMQQTIEKQWLVMRQVVRSQDLDRV